MGSRHFSEGEPGNSKEAVCDHAKVQKIPGLRVHRVAFVEVERLAFAKGRRSCARSLFHVEMPSGGQAVFPSFLARNLGLAGRRQSEYAVLLRELVTLPTSLLEFVFIAFPGWRLVS
jgi:hypothetical protein